MRELEHYLRTVFELDAHLARRRQQQTLSLALNRFLHFHKYVSSAVHQLQCIDVYVDAAHCRRFAPSAST